VLPDVDDGSEVEGPCSDIGSSEFGSALVVWTGLVNELDPVVVAGSQG